MHVLLQKLRNLGPKSTVGKKGKSKGTAGTGGGEEEGESVGEKEVHNFFICIRFPFSFSLWYVCFGLLFFLSLTHSHTHSLTQSLTHSLTHLLTHSLSHSLIHHSILSSLLPLYSFFISSLLLVTLIFLSHSLTLFSYLY